MAASADTYWRFDTYHKCSVVKCIFEEVGEDVDKKAKEEKEEEEEVENEEEEEEEEVEEVEVILCWPKTGNVSCWTGQLWQGQPPPDYKS